MNISLPDQGHYFYHARALLESDNYFSKSKFIVAGRLCTAVALNLYGSNNVNFEVNIKL
jgi:hypothetical protein